MMRLRGRSLTGRQVLAMILGFFGTVAAVNGIMVWLAIDSFPGLVSRDAYREGLAWNRTLEARRLQTALGWKVAVEVTGRGSARTIVARFRDHDGTPLAGLTVLARMVRPVMQGRDRAANMSETAPGLYSAAVELPAPGNWRLKVEAVRGREILWRMERALWLE